MQGVLFHMILEQSTDENQNPNYHLFRERWDYIAQNLGMYDFNELLHFAKQSGIFIFCCTSRTYRDNK